MLLNKTSNPFNIKSNWTYKRQLGLILLLCFHFNILLSQNCSIDPIKQLSTLDELSHNGVISIFEDSDGFIWLGTYDGLNKYNGYNFKKYRNTYEKKILTSNRILALNEDLNKKLWIGTQNGINILDLTTEEITTIYMPEKNDHDFQIIKKIIIQSNGFVLCLLRDGNLLEFDNNYKLIGKYKSENHRFKNRDFRDIVKISDNKYLISSSAGLLIFNAKAKKFNPVLVRNVRSCFDILKIDESNILVVKSHGIAQLKLTNKLNFTKILFPNKRYKNIAIDKQNTLWLTGVSTITKVFNFRPDAIEKNLKVCFLKSEKDEIYPSSINTTIKNSCWITTYNKGLYQFEANKNPFNNYNKKYNQDYGLKTNTIVALSPYKENQIFISTYLGEISLFDVAEKKFLPLPFTPPVNTKFTGVIFKDSKDNVWFSPRGNQMGLFMKKKDQDNFKLIASKDIPIFNNAQIRLITEDKFGFIWVSDKKDVYRISTNNNAEIVNIESLNKINSFSTKFSFIKYIYCDPINDLVWLGSENRGLYRVAISNNTNLEQLKIKNYNSYNNKNYMRSNYVSHIIRDRKNSLWIASDQGGICNITNEVGIPKFKTYSEKDGLINNGVKRIECDSENNLWLSTNAGISKFSTEKKQFRKYQKDDGLPFLQFQFTSISTPNESLIFGGREGFVYFNPKDLKKKNEVPSIQFGDFKLFNKIIKPKDSVNGKVLLEKKISLLDKIELDYNQNVFSIDVSSLHFKSPNNHFLKHKLSPIDKDWVKNPSYNNTIYYSGLPPGEYTFEVMASNSDNVWSKPKKLSIVIRPHYLKTKWAYLIYSLLALALLSLGILLTLRFYKLQHKLEIKQLEKIKEHEISDAKLRFFSNISHEFRTPLTLISGPLELFFERFKSDKFIGDYLKLVQRQSKKILHLVEQAHDFRKVEKDLLPIHLSKFNFTLFIEQLLADFKYLAIKKEITLNLKPNIGDVYIVADKNKIENIFNNLLSNAFKFTKKEDSITVSIIKKNDTLICEVADTGKGVSKEDLPFIFNRFYQSSKAPLSGGSGIGLAFSKKLIELHNGKISVQSKENIGSQFIVELPIGNLDSLEISKDDTIDDIDKLTVLTKEHNLSKIEIEDTLKASKIFIVEDNDDMRFFLEDVFSTFFNIQVFSNGKECLDALTLTLPDLIITDLMMPGINGIKLCGKIKNDIRTSHIPLILLTAVSTMEHQLKGLNVGADVYINKPFEVKNLVLQTIMLLKNRQILRERFQKDFLASTPKIQEDNCDQIFLNKLFTLIDKNLSNHELDANYLSKELCISRSHFFQKVKSLTDKTPYELIKTYRLRKASEILAKGNNQVLEVCISTGFKSVSYFSRAFKSQYGVSPSKYK